MKHAPLALALALGAVTAPALVAADELEGTVLAFDRVAEVLVMKDKTVIPVDTLEGDMPEGLVAGDRVAVNFDSDEDNGVTKVYSVTRID